MYAAKQLAVVIVSQVKNDPRVKGSVLLTALRPFTRLELSPKMLLTVKREAFKLAYGTEKGNMQFIESLVKLMSDGGHKTKIDTLNGMEMRTAMMAHKANQHKLAENAKKTQWNALRANAPPELRAKLKPQSWKARKIAILTNEKEQKALRKICTKGAKYFSAVYFIPKVAEAAVPHIAKLIQLDGAAGKGMGGKYNHMTVCGVTPNNNIFPLMYKICMGNESNRTWGDAIQFLKLKLPGLNDKLFTGLVDGDKGESSTS
jgi:hypothetical protein